MNLPPKLNVANLPTPIHKLEKLSAQYGKNLYIKRDDFTGSEWSGNKIRKLEYAVQEALNQSAKVLITCGGLQSNHARATVAIARTLGLKTHLVLRGEKTDSPEGNLFLDMLYGTEVSYLSPDAFNENYLTFMDELKANYDAKGQHAYIIPMGASNGIGTFGYYNCYQEICTQESEMGVKFDAICTAIGSGGTYGGLFLGNLFSETPRQIAGFNISATPEYFRPEISRIVRDSMAYMGTNQAFNESDICIYGGYEGIGYALTQPDELEFIKEIAALEGIILDPVYTGKAFRGFLSEIKKGAFKNCDSLLFIHTGGLHGLHAFRGDFSF